MRSYESRHRDISYFIQLIIIINSVNGHFLYFIIIEYTVNISHMLKLKHTMRTIMHTTAQNDHQ